MNPRTRIPLWVYLAEPFIPLLFALVWVVHRITRGEWESYLSIALFFICLLWFYVDKL